MNKAFDLKDLYPIIEEQLSNGGTACFKIRGTSMSPLFIDGQTTVKIKSYTDLPQKYDIALYRRDDGSFILHRIISADERGYICRGDNQFEKEYGVSFFSVIAYVSEYDNGEGFISTNSFKQKIYSRFWVNTTFIRYGWRKIVNMIRKR